MHSEVITYLASGLCPSYWDPTCMAEKLEPSHMVQKRKALIMHAHRVLGGGWWDPVLSLEIGGRVQLDQDTGLWCLLQNVASWAGTISVSWDFKAPVRQHQVMIQRQQGVWLSLSWGTTIMLMSRAAALSPALGSKYIGKSGGRRRVGESKRPCLQRAHQPCPHTEDFLALVGKRGLATDQKIILQRTFLRTWSVFTCKIKGAVVVDSEWLCR